MLEMNRNEFEKAMSDVRTDHAHALSEHAENLQALEEELKTERAEKISALQQVQHLASGTGATAPIGDSPRTKHVAQLENTLAQLRAEVARRDVADAPNVPSDVSAAVSM